MNQLTAFRARFLVPITQPPISDGMVAVDAQKIAGIGRFSEVSRKFPGLIPIDLGDVAVLPGLINAHTHLEFSDLKSPLGSHGIQLTDWISALMQNRKSNDLSIEQRIEIGLKELIESGTAAVGEIATTSYVPNVEHIHDASLQEDPISVVPRIVSFYELIGSSPERIEIAKSNGVDHFKLDVGAPWLSSNANESMSRRSWRAALSPHAPYSCHVDLLQWACQQSQKHQSPVAMHLAETREELVLLASQQGPFREMLEKFGVWNPSAFETSRTPMDYLQILAKAERSLVIHGNYLSDAEIQFAAEHHNRMSVVFCPRTHAFFQHEAYPLERMLSTGVAIALGTDSRASNPDLSVWNEAKFVARNFAQIEPSKILEMVTIAAAKSLGLEQSLGSLEVGKQASLKVVQCGEVSKDLLLEALLSQG